jgi:hypothetical protein
MSSPDSERLVHRSVVRFDLPYSIDLPDGSYKVVLNSYLVLVNIKSNKRSGNVVGAPPNAAFAGDMTLMNDRWGRFHYTSVVAIFEHSPNVPYDVALDFGTVERAVGAINRIIEVMRYVTSDIILQKLARTDLFSYSVQHFDSNGIELPGLALAIDGNMRFNVPAISDQNIRKISEMLANNGKMPIYVQLLMDARDSHYYGNFRVAVTEAESAFEIFVQQFLATKYHKQGMDDTRISQIIDKTGFINLAQNHINKFLSGNFGSSPQFIEWENRVYKLRKKVIHYGHTPSVDESKDAVETVNKTIMFIMSLA